MVWFGLGKPGLWELRHGTKNRKQIKGQEGEKSSQDMRRKRSEGNGSVLSPSPTYAK